jgi:hypothetical protein
MEQREVQDHQHVKWQCSQAFAGAETKFSAQAKEQTQRSDGKVIVICTTSPAHELSGYSFPMIGKKK